MRTGGAGAGRLVLVFALFVALGGLATYPLIRYLDRGLPYTHAPAPGLEVVDRFPGDYLQFYYHLWLFRDGVLGPTPAFADPYEFTWDGPQPGIRTYFVPLSLVYLALTPLGDFAAYNGFVLASYGLAGLAMFLLARQLVGTSGAALLAGTIFALAPYRHAVAAGGHPAGAAFFLVPLALLGVEQTARTGSRAGSLLAGGALVSLALVEPHFLYFLLLLLPVLLLVRTLPPAGELGLAPRALAEPDARRALRRGAPVVALLALAVLATAAGRGWAGGPAGVALGAGAGAAVGAAWIASGLLLARLRDEPLAASLRAALWGLAPLGLLGLSPLRLVWDLPRLTPRLGGLAAGLVVLAHAALLLGHPRGRARLAAAARALRPFWPLAALALVAAGVMLYLKATAVDASIAGGGRPAREIALFSPTARDWLTRFNDLAARSIYPGALALALGAVGAVAGLRRAERATRRWIGLLVVVFLLAEILSLGPNGLLALYDVLYRTVPFFGLIRQPAKFQVLAFAALALLAAFGTRALLGAVAARRGAGPALAALLVLGVAADYWPARPVGVSLLPTENRAYPVLRQPGDGTALYVPIWPGDSSWSSLYQFVTTLTRRPMVNGYSPVVSRRYVDEVYWPLDHLNRGEVTEREYARLRGLGVRFLVLDRGAFPGQVSPFNSGFTLARLRASPYVDLAVEDPPLWLFALRETPRAAAGALPTTPYGLFFEAERLPRRVGGPVAEPGASWGRVARAAEGPDAARAGFLVFGARAGLPRGSFRMVFHLRGHGPGEAPVARIEAVADGGQRVIASRPLDGRALSGRYEDHAVTFALDRPEWVEFRVFWEGRGELAVDYLYGHFADQPDPPVRFENDEFGFGAGPFRRLPPGEHVLRFRTRVDRRLDAPVARFTVATAHERTALATRTVRGLELEAAGAYQEIALPFRLETPRVLEFLIDFLAPGVSVDRITVARRG